MISLSDLRKFKTEGRKFSCLTCYDASMAKAMEFAEIDSILIGDSLGMVIQGHDSTLLLRWMIWLTILRLYVVVISIRLL